MTVKKSFVVVLKIVFLFFSLIFVRDAFYYWDGYSYYMRFKNFLPDLSLAFILWTVQAVIFSLISWASIYMAYKAIPKFLNIRFELLVMILLIGGMPLFIKRTYFEDVSVSDVLGVNHYVLLILGGAVLIGILLFLRKYAGKMLDWLNGSITPLVWLFTCLVILSVPLSFIRTDSSAGDSTSSGAAEIYPESRRRPNIILLTMDALTARDMQLYGYKYPTTPFISEWAKNAVVFNRAYSSANWTPPASMSLMTGQRPWTHHVWYQIKLNPINNYRANLPEVLKDNGYALYGFVQNVNAHPEILGIKNAFINDDKYDSFWIAESWWFGKLSQLFIRRPIVMQWMFDDSFIADKLNYYRPDTDDSLAPAEMVFDRFLKYMSQLKNGDNRNKRRPFFAWLHVYPPHSPYLPPDTYAGKFGDAGIYDSEKKQYRSGVIGDYSIKRQADADILRKRYDEHILYCDQTLKVFMLRLAKTIDMSNTIVILSSDHGESFSDGYQGHAGDYLYEQLVNIPLIIKIPGTMKGKLIDMPVEQIDIAPTILEFAGITPPEWMEGRSLTPLIKGGTFEWKPVFSVQLIKNRLFGSPISKGTIAVWEGDYKLIYYLEDKKVQLFNLKSDPDESVNIAEKNPEITQRLKKLIQDNLADANKRIAQIEESS